MNTHPVQSRKSGNLFTRFIALIAFAFTLQTASAEIRDRDRPSLPALAGMYKVTSSTDPFFPVATDREWFLDFNRGVTEGQTSGKVAVSLRQNPNVKVRIMVWQVFPNSNQLYLGNQFSEGSRGAVALADWKVRNVSEGVVLERHGFQIVLQKADPSDY